MVINDTTPGHQYKNKESNLILENFDFNGVNWIRCVRAGYGWELGDKEEDKRGRWDTDLWELVPTKSNGFKRLYEKLNSSRTD